MSGGEVTVDILKDNLGNAAKIPEKVFNKMNQVTAAVKEGIDQAEENIEKIHQTLGELDRFEGTVIKEAFNRFYAAEAELVGVRDDLFQLALTTISKSKVLQHLIKNWDKNPQKILEAELKMAEQLVTESLATLKNAQQKYDQVMASIRDVQTNLKEMTTKVNNMVDENSDDYEKWTTGIRGGVYGTSATSTTTCIFVDAFLTFGKLFRPAASTFYFL